MSTEQQPEELNIKNHLMKIRGELTNHNCRLKQLEKMHQKDLKKLKRLEEERELYSEMT